MDADFLMAAIGARVSRSPSICAARRDPAAAAAFATALFMGSVRAPTSRFVKALVCRANDEDIGTLRFEDVTLPLGPLQALNVRAANFPDGLMVQGKYPQHHPDLPFTVGGEFAGEVIGRADVKSSGRRPRGGSPARLRKKSNRAGRKIPGARASRSSDICRYAPMSRWCSAASAGRRDLAGAWRGGRRPPSISARCWARA